MKKIYLAVTNGVLDVYVDGWALENLIAELPVARIFKLNEQESEETGDLCCDVVEIVVPDQDWLDERKARIAKISLRARA